MWVDGCMVGTSIIVFIPGRTSPCMYYMQSDYPLDAIDVQIGHIPQLGHLLQIPASHAKGR